jgi:hypothetical protein
MPEINIIVKAKDEASAVLKNVGGSFDQLQKNAQAAIIPLTAVAAVGTALIGKGLRRRRTGRRRREHNEPGHHHSGRTHYHVAVHGCPT